MENNEQLVKVKHLEKLIQDQQDIIAAHNNKVKETQEEIWRVEIERDVKGEFYAPLEGMDATRKIYDELEKTLISLKKELADLNNKSHAFNEKVIVELNKKISLLKPEKLFKKSSNTIQPL